MGRTQRQTTIPGTASDEEQIIESLSDKDRKAIDDGLDHWLSRQSNQRQAAGETKIAHASLVQLVSDHKLTRWPFIDPKTGKKKHLVIKRDPKAATMNAPRFPRRRGEKPGEEVVPKSKAEKKAETEAKKVESRKVKRGDVKAELDKRDSEVRAKDDADSPMAQGAAAVDGALRPAQSYDDDLVDRGPVVVDDEVDPFAATRGAMADADHAEATEH